MAELNFHRTTSGRDRLGLRTEMREKELAKRVPGARWDKDDRLWTYPVSYVALTQINSVFGTSVTVADDVKAWAMKEYERRLSLYHQRTTVSEHDTARWSDLTDPQKAGAGWMTQAMGAVLADEMGSGKTVQACQALAAAGAKRVIIVCPNSVKDVWVSHIAEWTDLTPVNVVGNTTQRRKLLEETEGPAAFILHWGQLMAHSRLVAYGNTRLSEKEREPKELNAEHFDAIIADEAHRMKNPKAKQTRALKAITADMRIAMTGTPISNNPADFWSLLNFIQPDDWPSRNAFIERYCVTQWNPWGGSDIVGLRHDTRQEFYQLIDPFFLRRQKHEVIGKKIAKVPRLRMVELGPKHRKQYDQFRDELIARIEGGFIMATNPLAATARLVQLAGAMLEYDEPNDKYRMIKPSPKVDELVELAEDLGDEPFVVYSSSKQLLYLARAALEKAKVSVAMVTGDTPSEDRGTYVDRFQEGHYRAFLATTGAGAEGITLTRAKRLVFLQRSWSMVDNKQAEDRIHRYGQEADEVEIIDIITKDTIDERVYSVFGDKQGRLQELTRDEILELL